MSDGREWLDRVLFNERRLRSGWRILLFAVLLFVLLVVAELLLRPLPAEARFWSAPVVALAATLAAGWLLLARLDERPIGALGFAVTSSLRRELGLGMAIGGGLLGLVVLLLVGTGAVHWVRDDGGVADYAGMLIGSLFFFAVAAAWEEALFRGYPFQVLVEGIGVWPAIVLSNVVFAWAHGQNPEVGWLALGNIFLAGVLLSLAYLRTRSLWFATAVHTGWNWAMAFWLDLPVSGITRFDTPGYSGVAVGPDWWTGGAFGPEAGIAATFVLLAGIAWLLRTRAIGVAPEMAALRPIVDRRIELSQSRREAEV